MAENPTAIVDATHPEHVERQLEKILDEDTHRNGVLVRLRGDQDQRAPVLRSASYRMLQRSLAQNARDVLPTAAEDEPAVRRRKSAEMRRFGVLESLPQSSPRRLRSQADQALSALRRSPPISRHAEHSDRGTISEFWTSRTALVELPADELRELVRDVPEIADIYPNRELEVPRVVEPKRLPENITDSKVSAWGLVAIGSLAVWGAVGSRGAGVKVGVLDTGVDAEHPDLVGKVSDWAELDATGQVVQGSIAHDTGRHGTHVCGTIAGGDASGKFIGVAPEARLAVGLVLDGEIGGTDAQILAGLDWARTTAKVDVLNLSLGGFTLGPEVPSTYSEAFLTYVQSGIPVVTAIGNEGSQTSGSPGNDLLALAVGASDSKDRCAGFSGGRTQLIRVSTFIPPDFLPLPYSKPEISAPGVAVYRRSRVENGLTSTERRWQLLTWLGRSPSCSAQPPFATGSSLPIARSSSRTCSRAASRSWANRDKITASASGGSTCCAPSALPRSRASESRRQAVR